MRQPRSSDPGDQGRSPAKLLPQATHVLGLPREHGLDPAQLALVYVNSRPFVTSTLIGATTLAQLATDIGSVDVELSAEVLEKIEAIHLAQPNPSP